MSHHELPPASTEAGNSQGRPLSLAARAIAQIYRESGLQAANDALRELVAEQGLSYWDVCCLEERIRSLIIHSKAGRKAVPQ